MVILVLLILVSLQASPLWAGIRQSFDLENGRVPNGGIFDPNGDGVYPNLVPAMVLTESNGNHFLRMTASPSDCGLSFATTCPRTRAEIWIGSTPGSDNQSATFSFAMRIPRSNPNGHNNLLFQLFQGLGDPINSGRTIWIGSQNGRLFLENGLTHTTADLGSINYDQWVKFSVGVYLTTNAPQGRADAYINGALAGSIVGEATEKIAGITNMYLNVIDFGGVLGIADFDNLQISSLPGFWPVLIWQQDEIDTASIWYMGGIDGSTLLTSKLLSGPIAGWRIVGVADFDENGHPDLIWQQDGTNMSSVWYMGGADGSTFLNGTVLGGPTPGWRIVGVADFDENGHPDLIWQQDGSNMPSVWYMGGADGSMLLNSKDLGGPVPGWRIVGPK
jgi:hypothetical protein